MNNRSFVFVFFILIFYSHTTRAQLLIGPVGGANMAGIKTNAESNSILKWGAGLSINYYLTDNFALQTEPLYILKGGRLEATQNDPRVEVALGFIEIPVQLKYQVTSLPSLYLFAGPSIGFLLSAKLESPLNGLMFESDIKHLTENIEFSLTGGGGIAFPLSVGQFFVEARYVYGFTKLANSGPFTAKAGHVEVQGYLEADDNYQSTGVQLFAGFLINL